MTETDREKRCREMLTRAVNGDWSIFTELARIDEPDLRRILRSHKDEGFSEAEQKEKRQRLALDRALDRLLLLEMGIEIECLPPLLSLPPQFPVDDFKTLLHSDAFGRYLDVYLYVGVRIVAGRAFPAMTETFTHGEHADVNELPVALPSPPPVVLRQGSDVALQVGRFIDSQRAQRTAEIQTALAFLDGFVEVRDQHALYELWLRGFLRSPEYDALFTTISRGLMQFAKITANFYLGLESDQQLTQWTVDRRIERPWYATNPLTARFGLNELYWLSRLLRMDVSPDGLVSGTDPSWLKLIGESGRASSLLADRLSSLDEVLHGVFDSVCDLVQDAATVSRDDLDRARTPEYFAPKIPGTCDWRSAYGQELDEINKERKERRFDKAVTEAHWADGIDGGSERWSRRARSGDHIGDLVGLAFSGGGIRSATFNLGVLQRLKELDLLRHVDYLSTVSGGGYIGAWLLGNVRRSAYWLTPLTDWSGSIGHLRRFSNYLAPHKGLLSADTWAMWLSWVRNAALIQLTAAIWVAVLLVGARLNKFVFEAPLFASLSQFPGNLAVVAIIVLVTGVVCKNLKSAANPAGEPAVIGWAVFPVWLGSFLVAAMLFASSGTPQKFSAILSTRWKDWATILGALLAGFACVSWCSIGLTKHGTQASKDGPLAKARRAAGSVGVAIASLLVLYLSLCGVQWAFEHFGGDHRVWFAYVFGGPLVVLAMGLAIIIIIGLVGPDSPDWGREWWTRFGAWLGIFGVFFLALSLTSIYGPDLVMWAIHLKPKIAWGTVIGWIGTVAGGLLAGNSEKTNGDERGPALSQALGVFSKIAAALFLAGALILVATGVHVLLVEIWPKTDVNPREYWHSLGQVDAGDLLKSLGVLALIGAIVSWRFEINIFGLNQFYRNRLIRCYLGATRWRPGLRKAHPFTGFDAEDDLPLWQLQRDAKPPGPTPFRGPFPIINCSLNLGGSSDLDLHTRHSASFVLTPLRCGADRRQVGYVATHTDGAPYAGGVYLGQAISVSGAAASPNMGYSTSPLVAVLLTLFNVRLAWWFPNPGRTPRVPFVSLYYLVKELFGIADERGHFINVSDGGHFENLGIYELVRRRCKVIIACDAECDSKMSFGSLGNVVRICETDLGARIDIDVTSIERQKDAPLSRSHCAVGRITYSNGSQGYLIYLKSSVTGDEDVGIAQYRAGHPAFPHESTADQFFAEDQFESYRRLGYHIADEAFRSVESDRVDLIEMAAKLADMWVPAGIASEFVAQANEYTAMMDRFRRDRDLHDLFRELMEGVPAAEPLTISAQERAACLQLLQIMENAFLGLRLDSFWTHPDNRGWVILFSRWARSRKFRQVWEDSHNVYGIRFAYFCNERLGLPIEREAQRS